jgi:uncharacterized protein (TIGR00251 family)
MKDEDGRRKAAWYGYDSGRQCLSLTLHVQPNARSSSFSGLHGDALKVRIAAPAADNAANLELVRFLSEALGVPRSAIALKRGATSRRKMIEIAGGPPLLRCLEELVGS